MKMSDEWRQEGQLMVMTRQLLQSKRWWCVELWSGVEGDLVSVHVLPAKDEAHAIKRAIKDLMEK